MEKTAYHRGHTSHHPTVISQSPKERKQRNKYMTRNNSRHTRAPRFGGVASALQNVLFCFNALQYRHSRWRVPFKGDTARKLLSRAARLRLVGGSLYCDYLRRPHELSALGPLALVAGSSTSTVSPPFFVRHCSGWYQRLNRLINKQKIP